MDEDGPGRALGGAMWRVPAQMVPVASRRLGPGDVTVLVVGVLLAVLGAAANLFLTTIGGLDVLGGWCRSSAGGVGCRYLWVWLYGPWGGLALAVVVGIAVGRWRWARGRGTWPALPLGSVLYLPIVAAALWALSSS